jgi:two-component system, NarL family, response regulator NreC
MKAARSIRILLADDHAVLRAGLRLLIDGRPDMKVVEEAADGAEAVRKTRTARPDVVVFDLTMPRTNPRAAIEQIVGLGARVLVLTMHDDRAYVDAALAAGASGYVVKKAADVELLAAIRAVSRGRRFVDVTQWPGTGTARRAATLSAREERVIGLIARGHTNREIAAQLRVSIKTIETFRARACDKLGLRSRAELVQYAMRMNMMDPDRDPGRLPAGS